MSDRLPEGPARAEVVTLVYRYRISVRDLSRCAPDFLGKRLRPESVGALLDGYKDELGDARHAYEGGLVEAHIKSSEWWESGQVRKEPDEVRREEVCRREETRRHRERLAEAAAKAYLAKQASKAAAQSRYCRDWTGILSSDVARRQKAREIGAAVLRMRDAGLTWQRCADLLHVTTERARQIGLRAKRYEKALIPFPAEQHLGRDHALASVRECVLWRRAA